MKKIKVVHLANLDVTIPIHLGNYVRYLQNQGYDVSIVCHPGRWLTHDTTIMDGTFVKIIPFEPRITPFSDLKTLIRLILYFRQEKFDIVHTHTVKPGLLGGLAARIAGMPIILHTLHGLWLHNSLHPLLYRFMALIAKIVTLCSHLMLSQNKQDIQTAIREGICPPNKIDHLGNGIDLSRFGPDCVSTEKVEALRAELGIEPQHAVIGLVARLVREKGIYEYIEAARILKSKGIEAKYLSIGVAPKGKPSAVSPEELIREYGLEDDVLLLGFRDDIPELLSLMDVIAFPSHGFEGIPRALMEGAAMGKPVVATRVRGNIEVVEDGQTGLLVPAHDAPALAEGLFSLLGDPERAAKLGQQARQHALTHFDERLFFWKTDVEYRRLLKTRLAMNPDLVLKPIPTA